MSTNAILPHRSEFAEGLADEAYRLAKRLSIKVAKKWPHYDPMEIESAAMLGAWEAALAWSPQRGFRFSTFAYFRIHGAILDAARSSELRGYRRRNGKRQRDVPKVHRLYISKHRDGLHDFEAESGTQAGELSVPGDFDTLDETIEDLFRCLPIRHKQAMTLLYSEAGQTMQRVGRRLGLSGSRIRQIHLESIRMIRESRGITTAGAEAVAS